MDYYDDYVLEEDKMGMTVTSGSVTLKKDAQNLVGISIGGGAPLCPCLYVVQVFDNTPAAKDGTLQAGDEVVAINGQNVKGKTKVEVAKLIQSFKGEVTVFYNKLHADPKQGKSLDIVLKKLKHRMVESLQTSTADALGLSRAILVNDSMVKRLNELEATAGMYNGLVARVKKLLQCYYALSQTHKAFGDAFAEIGVKELQPRAAEAFTKFGNVHRAMERCALDFMRKARPIVSDLNTFLLKAVPDTKLTIEKYLDAKFEYLSYCLKVKEMDDEEYAFAALQEPLYRVETGNYEYRLILRCREMARKKFAKLRSDVLVKLELLDQKHVQDIVFQLQRFITHLAQYAQDCYGCMKEAHGLFPIEIDITRQTFTLDRAAAATGISSGSASHSYQDEPDDEDDDGENDDEDVLALENTATPSSAQLQKTGAGADLLQLDSGAADGSELLGDFGYPGAATSAADIGQSVAPRPSASAASQLLDFGSPNEPAKGELDWQFDELAQR